jgi:putative addiction module killer protein
MNGSVARELPVASALLIRRELAQEQSLMCCAWSEDRVAGHSLLTANEAVLTFVAHKIHFRMPTVIKSEAFAEWIDNLRDRAGVAQVLRRLARLERGNPGRVAPVGEGVSELKIDFGPGYRVYFGQRGEELVIILGGGDKSSQDRDIRAAKKLWDEWKEQNHEES